MINPMGSQNRVIQKILFCIFFGMAMATSAVALTFEERIDRLFTKWNRPSTPGLALGVIKDNQMVYFKGYGAANLAHGIPISATTVFDIGSNTKQFTAFCILLLQEEGKLSLDDDLRKYFPERADFGETITLRHLMHHTCGIRDYLGVMAMNGWFLLDDIVTQGMGLRMIEMQRELNHPVGETFSYTNSAYILLAEIVNRVSGKSIVQFADERIFLPLGMKNTHFYDNHRTSIKNAAESYDLLPGGVYQISPFAKDSVGDSGVYSTVEDLILWDENFYSNKVGSQSILDVMHEPLTLNNGQTIPYGGALMFSVSGGRRIVYHGGDIAGFHSNLIRFPDEHLSIILLANTSEMLSNVLYERALQVASVYFNTPPVTSVPEFQIHEPAPFQWGQSFSPNLFPDVDQYLFLQSIYQTQSDGKTRSMTPQSLPQMTFEKAKEFEGRYFSEETEAIYTLEFDAKTGYLFFSLPRIENYMVAGNVSRDIITFVATPGITGRFFRNSLNQVSGMQLSVERAQNMKFRKMDISFME